MSTTVFAGSTAASLEAGLKLAWNARYVVVRLLAYIQVQEREERRVHAFQHANVDSLLEAEALGPNGLGSLWRVPERRKRRRDQAGSSFKHHRTRAWNPKVQDELIGEDLSDDEQMSRSAATLALPLLVPVMSARGLLENKFLKQTFYNPHMTALSRTALSLIESENVMHKALGRCFGAMERILRTDENIPSTSDKMGKTKAATELWDVSPPLAHINDLFITQEGVTVPMPDQKSPETTTEVTFSPEEQRDIVYSGLECLNELYSDSREYMERLTEMRMMLADIKRHRAQIWNMLRKWALKREEQDFQTSQLYRRYNNGERETQDAEAEAGSDENGDTPNSRGKSSSRGEWIPGSRSRPRKYNGKV